MSVYGPLRKHYSAAVNEWNISHAGRRITTYDLPASFARSFYKAFSYDNIESVNYTDEEDQLQEDTLQQPDGDEASTSA